MRSRKGTDYPGPSKSKLLKNLDFIIRASGRLLKRLKFKKSTVSESSCNPTVKNGMD